ncbi:hypothetical protein [Brevibacillus dissolubilis]|uniref:hypothetical protein n=1 Tax=Brevibacillus dissolubilis TaxID=1844116 RepID=UPI001115CF4E|nr:hypothetical protein [Brevibacillus dissolubilis]
MESNLRTTRIAHLYRLVITITVWVVVANLITWGIYLTAPAFYEWYLLIPDALLFQLYIIMDRVVVSIFFLMWINYIHADLKDLAPAYPISKWGSMLLCIIPGVNIFGIFIIFAVFRRFLIRLAPHQKKTGNITLGVLSLTYVLTGVMIVLSLKATDSDWADQAGALVTLVSFVHLMLYGVLVRFTMRGLEAIEQALAPSPSDSLSEKETEDASHDDVIRP